MGEVHIKTVFMNVLFTSCIMPASFSLSILPADETVPNFQRVSISPTSNQQRNNSLFYGKYNIN